MKKPVIAIAAISIAVLAGVGLVVLNKDDDKSTPANSTPDNHSEVTSETTGQEEESQESPATQVSSVSIEGFSFSPAEITVKKGTTVTWTNKDSVVHTVTPDTEGGDFGSGDLTNGATYSYTFEAVGTFNYHCRPHPSMKGTVIVTE